MESGGERERACVNAHRELEIGVGGRIFINGKKSSFIMRRVKRLQKKFIKDQ
jgi:hypothetical protein